MNWHEAALAYRRHLLESGRSKSTDLVVRYKLRLLSDFCQAKGIIGPGQFTRADLDAFQRFLETVPGRRGPRVPNQIVELMSRVVLFLSWAEKNRLIFAHPDPERILPKKIVPLVKVPTVAEVARLLEAPNTNCSQGLRDRVMLELLYSTGIRRGECRALDLKDIQLEKRQISVRHSKTGKCRALPIGQQLHHWLQRYLEFGRSQLRPGLGEQALFITGQTGARLVSNSVQKIFERHAKQAGLVGFSIHSLRHATATHLLAAGMDLRYIQQLLGHSSINSTLYYTQLTISDLTEEHIATHPRPYLRK